MHIVVVEANSPGMEVQPSEVLGAALVEHRLLFEMIIIIVGLMGSRCIFGMKWATDS